MSTNRPCFLIPVYNHKAHIGDTLDQLERFGLPVFLINDGSHEDTSLVLREQAKRPWVTLLERVRNGGKGEAMKDGMWRAFEQGFTHTLQVDADGQHNLADIPAMLAASEKYPLAMVLGSPRYGSDVPKGRLIGRQISRFWVWVETLSTAIEDPLLGFRVYPLQPCVRLIQRNVIGSRMESDLQFLVRLYWEGVSVINIPTHVIYPENGSSNFRMIRDNVQISWAHTRLVVAMLPRIPALLFRKGRAS